jgi:hypothetical protein
MSPPTDSELPQMGEAGNGHGERKEKSFNRRWARMNADFFPGTNGIGEVICDEVWRGR